MLENYYKIDSIYNYDKTVLNYKKLPPKTMTSIQETAGYKKRIALLALSNFSVKHKLGLMCVKSQSFQRDILYVFF